jgi:hypothetical protein
MVATLGYEQIVNQPFLYINGMNITVASTTTLTVTNGQCRDITDEFDIIIPAPFISSPPATTTINAAVNGLNGLDTGVLANNTWYAVYAIFSVTRSNSTNPAGYILSANLVNNPTLPPFYNVIRRIGWALTDGSAHFLTYWQAGNGSTRTYQWDIPITVHASADVTTSFAAQALNTAIPTSNALPTILGGLWTPNSAGDALSLRPTTSTSTNGVQVVSGDVAAVAHVIQPFQFIPALNTSTPPEPSIDLKGTSASDLLTLNVVGFVDYV